MVSCVNSLNDVSSFNMERVITIKGTIDSMSRAEGMISAKLRQSYESDLQAMAVSGDNHAGLNADSIFTVPYFNSRKA